MLFRLQETRYYVPESLVYVFLRRFPRKTKRLGDQSADLQVAFPDMT